MTKLLNQLCQAIDFKKLLYIIVVGILFINLALLTWYVFYGYHSILHSDSAVKVLIAREIVETGQYFPDDWNYVNGDLFVLFGHLFIIPLLEFFPAGFFVHAFSGIVCATITLSGIWLITSLFEIGKVKRLIIVSILASGLSGFTAENLYGQVSYGTVVYFSCYLIYFAWGLLSSLGRRKILFGIGLSVALVLAAWANPQRATISYALPLLVAVSCYIVSCTFTYSGTDSARVIRSGLALTGVVLLSIIVGVAFHLITLRGVNNVLGAGNALWLSYDEMMHNASLLLKQVFVVFGGLPSPGGVVASKSGLYQAIRLISALALLVLMPISLRIALQERSSGSQFVASFTLVSTLLTLFIQETTTVPVMSAAVQTSRYLIPPLIFLLIIALAQNYSLVKKPLMALVGIAVYVVFITSAYSNFFTSNNSNEINWRQSWQRHHNLENLKDFLLANDLHYGYATYWNAGVISVLSDEKVLIRQVLINGGLPMPHRHLSSNRWYRPRAWQGETFLLLTAQEASSINWDLLERRYQTKPLREVSFEGFKVFVFTQNLAKNIPEWDNKVRDEPKFNNTMNDDALITAFLALPSIANTKNGSTGVEYLNGWYTREVYEGQRPFRWMYKTKSSLLVSTEKPSVVLEFEYHCPNKNELDINVGLSAAKIQQVILANEWRHVTINLTEHTRSLAIIHLSASGEYRVLTDIRVFGCQVSDVTSRIN
jgi:hypothetical protein